MSEIKPALSHDEWGALRVFRERRDVGSWPVSGEIAVVGDAIRVGPPEFAPSVLVTSDDRHALAALALHGQPFGFTWDDVEAIHDWMQETSCHASSTLADRIAALLPPRE
jgi:hypothetical protein